MKKNRNKLNVQIELVDNDKFNEPHDYTDIGKEEIARQMISERLSGMSPLQKALFVKVSNIVNTKGVEGYVEWIKNNPDEVEILLDGVEEHINFLPTIDEHGNQLD